MSKISKLPFNHLLIKIDQVKYTTPCGEYMIEFTNFGYIDDINWVASRDGIYIYIGETLAELITEIVENNPFMETFLYETLYSVKK